MPTTDQVLRSCAAVERLGRAGLDLETFSREALSQLRRAVPFDGYCWATADPATSLPTWAMVEFSPGARNQKRFWELEFQASEVNRRAALTRGPRRVSTLSGSTAGDPARSPHWRELLQPNGMRDQLRAALMLDDVYWGSLSLYRERGNFTEDEAGLVDQLVSPLASGLRAGLVGEPLRFDATVNGPGLLILGPDLERLASTIQADRWLSHLGPPAPHHPSVVYGLVAHLRALEAAHAPRVMVARTRARLNSGRWLVLHATRLQGTVGQLAIVLEPAQPADLAPLLARGYRLSVRERAVAEQVLLGRSTAQIGAALDITPYTVRDHLKAIFAKVGVRSRRELGQVLAARSGSLAETGAAQD